ncbi:NUDIX domain-containing protein [Sphaerochaeta sp. PS]|uniref:(deoxy)nucleoside triphosphate pyrophosphohydrolase n=1 Tax=Sphaerochaeta sp. PS TaxID=3076336 RepID=UPI0028A49CFE|nr:NUDIX domain-containing protein [Sphaerochaeta sp. PS]MDT4763313.1 NUDIX domain-containing protein [Sphaerochaeta sp. PS]
MEAYTNQRITTAGALVREGKYFVAKREDKGSIGGLWEFPGGKNRWMESEEETLKREFQEELQLDIEVGSLFHTHDFINKETLYHQKAYFVSCPNWTDPILSVHTTYRWVTLQDLESLEFAPSDMRIIETLKKIATSS